MLTVVPYTPEHLLTLDIRAEHDPGERMNFGMWARALGRGPAATLVAPDGEPVCCAGIVPLWPGVGEVWIVASPRVGEHAVSFVRHAKRGLLLGSRGLGLRRVQAAVRRGYATGYRFAKALGFELEGNMRAYGAQGEDFVRMAYFPEDHRG